MSVSGITGNDGGQSPAKTQLTADINAFLKLMVAQVRNQDPTKPMDSTQWVAQLAQFSTVEQQVQSNGKLGDVLTELKSTSERIDLSYIGRKVEVEGDEVGLKDGVLAARYTVPKGAASVGVHIVDADGAVVRSFSSSSTAGTYDLSWDGKNSDGVKLADGTYTVVVDAKDEAGKAVAGTSVTYDATVTRVRRADGETKFDLSTGVSVARDAILSAA
ncbi:MULTISPECIES: flagellar hook assembly protein FlgD [unclassified Azospirillum]|uniref:flagellar hook assembly protein FlgD n=1 Tax=unclassified Azospirillum TaxID=2630922 RepID=UPI000B75A082|nr:MULTISPECIES: flagellar hook assembly protein FlgD [unclassified Azospirillum]SNS45840.1 flagellar basal-body rod modification protein FlgD [Azospirillum sp. RU38E]SNS64929.1 flagellar basal-body rod modification protein FlgD [Azospirillum sp. RU37A]